MRFPHSRPVLSKRRSRPICTKPAPGKRPKTQAVRGKWPGIEGGGPSQKKRLHPGQEAGQKTGAHQFKLTFEPTAVAGMGDVRSYFEQEGVFQDILDGLAEEIALPQDVPVTFKDCDSANAFWDPEARSLTMCWNLVAAYNFGYEKIKGEERAFLAGADQETVLTGTTTFILLHELGHGLVDLFDLPITGREEDAVDQFATLLLIGGDEPDDGIQERTSRLALLGAYFFRMMAAEPGDLARDIFADEHALGQQRYYDVMCLVFGSDSEAYGPILTRGLLMAEEAQESSPDRFDEDDAQTLLQETDASNILPYERAVRCEDEYQRYSASWAYMIEHFMQPAAK